MKFTFSIYALAFGMLSLGSVNVVVIKWMDMATVGSKRDGSPIHFKHPVFQSLLMFLGEALCLGAYFLLRLRKRIRRRQGLEPPSVGRKQASLFFLKRSLIFIIPSLLDAMGATVLNLALYYTYASVYQMLRGTLVLFAALLTTVILRRRLFVHHWLGVLLIGAGAAIVGAASIIHSPGSGSFPPPTPPPHFHSPPSPSTYPSVLHQGLLNISGFLRMLHGEGDSAPAPFLGDLLVILAQGLSALQFVIEEKLLSSWKMQPLLAVGLEGTWGIVICALSLPFLPLIKDSEGKPLDDLEQATREVLSNQSLLYCAVISVLSIGAFNFCGLSVTKALSGANRAAIDACRTLFVWIIALGLGWEKFKGLQLIGFLVLIAGSCLFNEVLRTILPSLHPNGDESEEEDVEEGVTDDLTAPLLRESKYEDSRTGSQSSFGRSKNNSSSHVVGNNSLSGSEAAGPSASPRKIKQAPRQTEQYSMARSLIMGIGTLEPKPLDEGGMSLEDDPDLSAPFDVSSVKFAGLLSQRMGADSEDGSGNQVGMKKSSSLSQMLAEEQAADRAAQHRGK